MNTFLTAQEIEELTDLKQSAAQVRWLASRGWPFEISALGKVKVLRSLMEAKMGISSSNLANRKAKPNVTALLDLMAQTRPQRAKPKS